MRPAGFDIRLATDLLGMILGTPPAATPAQRFGQPRKKRRRMLQLGTQSRNLSAAGILRAIAAADEWPSCRVTSASRLAGLKQHCKGACCRSVRPHVSYGPALSQTFATQANSNLFCCPVLAKMYAAFAEPLGFRLVDVVVL